ncbi:MAG: hypothetical protein WC890_07340 [Candidatus Margulisiibacteriota bacterium]
MKKIIALLTVFAFVLVLAAGVYASTQTELNAAKSQLSAIDAKLVKAKKARKTAEVKKLTAQKQGLLSNMAALKAQLAAETAVAVTPVTPPPTPVVRPVQAPVSAGIFGWGINTGLTLGYVAGNSVMDVRADLIMGDGLGIGPMLGMSQNAINWKLGLGYCQGNDITGTARKAVPVYFDGILNISPDILGGIQSYLGGGVNYAVTGSGQTGGSYGGQVYYGIQGDIGLGGNTYVEVGYSIVRSGATSAPYSMKGAEVNIGTQLMW